MRAGARERLAHFALVVFLLAAIVGPWIFFPGAMLATYAAVFNR